MSTRHRLYLALLALGAYAQVAQALLVRESLVVFYGNELTLGTLLGGWLLWVAIGAALVLGQSGRRWVQQPLGVLHGLLLALPWLLVAQIIATRAARLLLDVPPAELIPLDAVLGSALMITAPSSLALGVAFPLGCRGLEQTAAGAGNEPDVPRAVGGTSRLYVIEALGALVGGVACTFLMIEWLGVWRSIGLVTILLAAVAGLLRPRAAAVVLAQTVLGLALLATPLGGFVQQRMEALRFATLQPGLTLLDAVETRYGQTSVARLGPQISVVTDGRIGESFPDPRRVEQQAAYFYSQAAGARRLLLFGGVADGLAAELLRYPVDHIDAVVEDRRAFEHLAPYLGAGTRRALHDRRLSVHYQDARRYANTLVRAAAYDLVLVLSGDPSTAHGNRLYTVELYRGLRAAMAGDGVLCTQVSSASNYLGSDVASYSGSVMRTLSAVFPHLAVAPGDEHLYCASAAAHRVTENARELERRYLATPLPEHRFPSLSFFTLLPPDRIGYVRTQLLAEHAPLNTDSRPASYYLNMLLWAKFTASEFVRWLKLLSALGPWPYLVPVLVGALLLGLSGATHALPPQQLRRRAALLTLALLGLAGMAVQLTLLLSYQAHVGFMFGRIALLNGLFMTGLALGAGALGQRLARGARPGLALLGLLAGTAGVLALLDPLLDGLGRSSGWLQEGGYLAFTALAGLVTGLGFPLGMQLTEADTRNVLRSSALMWGADDLGGAVGGMLTGALLVPLLGITGTLHVTAGLLLAATLPLAWAELAPGPLPALARRGHTAFPYQALAWGLAWLTLTALLLSLAAPPREPAPLLHFDEGTLSAVSGSRRFVANEQPVPHYLGWDQAESGGEADTAALASMGVAAGVRGHAGPINLLVAVDRSGHLRGVHYVQSHETPSYIEDIEAWLGKLAGRDLSRAPLDLSNVDAMSGATVTSRAALATIDRAASKASELAFGRALATGGTPPTPWWQRPKLVTVTLLLLAFFPVYLYGPDRARLVYQVASLSVLGLGWNFLLTEVDLVNLSLGHLPDWLANPEWYLLMGFVLVTGLLFGQAYCGYVCPFGALQELLSRLGRHFYLRRYAVRGVDTRLRFVKFVLLPVVLVGAWWGGDLRWASFNPMQHVFHGEWRGWVGAITAASLLGALVYYRFWCRYLCPVGAMLALLNKVALLSRRGPTRRFEHCDLGVRHEFDVDCIRCNRCVSARDCGVRTKL